MFPCTARGNIAIAALVLASFVFADAAQTSAIRFDGVYYAAVSWPPGWGLKAKKGSALFLYFRFYPDGSVVSLLSTGRPMAVAKFMRRNLEESGNGTYSINGDRLHFRVTTRHGSVIYTGRVHGDALALRSYGSISVPLYQFAPVRFAK